MKKSILFILLVSTLIEAQEVSVFGAGDLNSKNPYGLNSSEKHILKNQKRLGQLSTKVNDVNTLIESVNKRLEGLESIFEGDSSKLNTTVLKMNDLVNKVELASEKVNKNLLDTAEIKTVSVELLNMKEETDKEFKKNIDDLKKVVSKISKLVNKINSEYVSSSELKSNMNQFITREEFNELKKSLGLKANSINANNSTSEKTNSSNEKLTSNEKAKMSASAKKYYEKQYFKNAIPIFEKLVSLNYKPAEGNYYLGEMWYVRKKYDLAINHFKKSAILYDQAAYMPTLLLHSAISFEKTKDKENARSFYSTLIDLYPSSSESKIAKKNLSKL